MSDKFRISIILACGREVTTYYTPNPDELEEDEVQAEILGLVTSNPRDFISIGELIVHTGAVSAIEVEAV